MSDEIAEFALVDGEYFPDEAFDDPILEDWEWFIHTIPPDKLDDHQEDDEQ